MSRGEPLPALERTLYVVATPIGNLRDLTLRALDVLGQVDVIAAEDTRVSAGLLAHYGFHARLVSLHEHNEHKRAAAIIESPSGKASCVTDAGTPAISDPEPRWCAVSAAGLDCRSPSVGGRRRFRRRASRRRSGCFRIPAAAGARRAALERCATCPMRWSSSRRRIALPRRWRYLLPCSIRSARERDARELTKRFETLHRCALADASAWLAADADRIRGEFVLIVAAPDDDATEADAGEHDALLKPLLAELPLAQAVRIAVAQSGAARNRLYQRALTLQKMVKASS